MPTLSKLKLSDKTRAQMFRAPELRRRQKLIDAIDIQISQAEADIKGEVFTLMVDRWESDKEAGTRFRKRVAARIRRWWWKDEAGNLLIDVRYGNKRIEFKPEKTSIEVGTMDQLVPTLQLVKEAVAQGELDKQIETCIEKRTVRFRNKQ